jgi:hypothetical protein
MKAEIKGSLRTKELEFAQKDNRNPRITPHKYLDKFIDLHKVFFFVIFCIYCRSGY